MQDKRKLGDASFLVTTDLRSSGKRFKTLVTLLGEKDVLYEETSKTPEEAFQAHQRVWERLEEYL